MTDTPRRSRRRIAGERTRRPVEPAEPVRRSSTAEPAAPVAPGAPERSEVAEKQEQQQPIDAAPRQRGVPRPYILALAALALVTVAAVVLVSVFVLWPAYEDQRVAEAQDEATGTAVAAFEQVFSFDYRGIEAELADDRGLLSNGYAGEFDEEFSATITQAANESQTTATATVLASAPLECGDDCTPDRVEVLVFADQEFTNRAGEGGGQPAGSVQQSRVIMTMVEEGDGWVVDGIEVL